MFLFSEYNSGTHGSGPASPSPSPTPDDTMVTETVGSKDGFYLLRKDSERRSTLVKVLGEDSDQVIHNEGIFSHKC